MNFKIDHNWLKFPQENFIPLKADVQGLSEDPETGELYLTFARNDFADTLVNKSAVLVFDISGNFIRHFGKEADGGGHGIRFIKVGSKKFVFVSCVKTCKVYKYNAENGELLLTISKPEFYGDSEFKPTNVAAFSDGSFVVTDGYRGNYILFYNQDAKLIKYYNFVSLNPKYFDQPHGVTAIDDRELIVSDRKNESFVRIPLDSNLSKSINSHDSRHPCNLHYKGEGRNRIFLVAELWHSIAIYDYQFNLISRLLDGYGSHESKSGYRAEKSYTYRKGLESGSIESSSIDQNYLLYPHDAIFTKKHGNSEGNIIVCEWNFYRRGTGVSLIKFI